KTIPPREIRAEVKKAKKYKPRLDLYVILTTGRKSTQAEKTVQAINLQHKKNGLFTVEVLVWEEIEALLNQYTEIRDLIYDTVPGRTVARFEQRLAALQIAVESSTQPTTEAIEADLDVIKAEIERHDLILATSLASRLEERHGDKLTPRQRW